LGKLGGIEPAKLIAVEFAVGSERDVIDVEVETHSDRVGRDKVFNIARLIELDLGIAGARRECAQNHRSAAALTPDQLSDGIDLFGRKCDHRRATWQPRDLPLSCKREL